MTAREEDEHNRRTCERAGQFGHWGCGICKHDLAYEKCEQCLRARVNAPRYPDGQIYEDDEGELELRVAPDVLHGVVIIDFRKPLSWIGLRGRDALQLADIIIKAAKVLPP